jgi:hypothetical protein
MPNDALEKRLGQAFDASQCFSDIITSVPFDPTGLSTWSSVPHPRSLLQTVQRGNLIEAMRNAASNQMANGQAVVNQSEETFMEVRQCMLQFAKHWEDGLSTFILQDEVQEWGIILRVSCDAICKVSLADVLYNAIILVLLFRSSKHT